MAAKSRPVPKRDHKLSANVNAEELKAYYQACEAAEIEASDTLRKLANALVLHVREHGGVSFPLRFRVVKDGST